MNRAIDLLQYIIWADNKISSLLEKLEPEELNKSFSETSGTIKQKLKHLAEEYIAWLFDIKSESWKEEIDRIKSMDCSELIGQMRKTLQEWIDFVHDTGKEKFLIDEGDFIVPIELDEVVFNLVNHSSYHRGQIVLFLRILRYEVNITDYYWYRINQLNLS
ncbi:MAG: DinB family protein [Candidatus Heimdallarchaeota archaeon]